MIISKNYLWLNKIELEFKLKNLNQIKNRINHNQTILIISQSLPKHKNPLLNHYQLTIPIRTKLINLILKHNFLTYPPINQTNTLINHILSTLPKQHKLILLQIETHRLNLIQLPQISLKNLLPISSGFHCNYNEPLIIRLLIRKKVQIPFNRKDLPKP